MVLVFVIVVVIVIVVVPIFSFNVTVCGSPTFEWIGYWKAYDLFNRIFASDFPENQENKSILKYIMAIRT